MYCMPDRIPQHPEAQFSYEQRDQPRSPETPNILLEGGINFVTPTTVSPYFNVGQSRLASFHAPANFLLFYMERWMKDGM